MHQKCLLDKQLQDERMLTLDFEVKIHGLLEG